MARAHAAETRHRRPCIKAEPQAAKVDGTPRLDSDSRQPGYRAIADRRDY